MSALPNYEVFAVRYATLKRKASENFIGADPHEAASDLDYFVWVARSPQRTFVIDTGFNEASARRRKREFLRAPTAGLKLLDVDPARVEDIIVTHLHYDHIGGHADYPLARYHLQDKELSFATGRHMKDGIFAHGYEVDEVCAMVREVYRGRVEFYDGDAELAPGLSVHHIGGHTMGIQSVRVHTRVGWIVLASDATHFYANMEQVRPFPIVYHVGEMAQGFRKLKALADDPRLVVPGHDPLVMQRYPAVEGLAGIAVRLDAEPKIA